MKNLLMISGVLLAFSLMSFTSSYTNPVTKTGKTEFTISSDARFSADEEKLFGMLDEKYYNLNSYTSKVSSIRFGDQGGVKAKIWIFKNESSCENKFTRKTLAGNGMIGDDSDLQDLYQVLSRHARK